MKRERWAELNPLWWPVMSLLVTLGGFSLGEVLIRLSGWNWFARVMLTFLVIPAALAPFIALVVLAVSFRHNAESLGRIISLYLALVLLCANINFLLMLHFGQSGSPPFSGIQSVWGAAVDGRPTPFIWGNAFLSFIDCLHFSFATLSSGASAIYPTNRFSKIVVDIERLMGLGITVLAVGRYFSRGGDKS